MEAKGKRGDICTCAYKFGRYLVCVYAGTHLTMARPIMPDHVNLYASTDLTGAYSRCCAVWTWWRPIVPEAAAVMKSPTQDLCL